MQALTPSPDAETTVSLPAPFDFEETLRFVRAGPRDPCSLRMPRHVVLAGRTPFGPATIELRHRPDERTVVARVWGEGAPWVLPRVPALVGVHDRPADFMPVGAIARLARRHRATHLPRSPWPWVTLASAILQQRVRYVDAVRAYATIVRKYGEPAPGPVSGLLIPPPPAAFASVPEHVWKGLGVESRRVRTLVTAARYAARVDALADADTTTARAFLQKLPGCGPWTVEMTMGFGLGDPDAVPMGDLHFPAIVGWALAAEDRADDGRMLELLEPYRPHRFRVLRMLFAEGFDAPGHRPRVGGGWFRRRP